MPAGVHTSGQVKAINGTTAAASTTVPLGMVSCTRTVIFADKGFYTITRVSIKVSQLMK